VFRNGVFRQPLVTSEKPVLADGRSAGMTEKPALSLAISAERPAPSRDRLRRYKGNKNRRRFLHGQKDGCYIHILQAQKPQEVNTMSDEQMLKDTADELKEFLNAKQVMGAPVDFGDKLVVPVARYGFGFGAGGNTSKDGGGRGAGAGGGIEPVALVILHKDVRGAEGVQVMSLKKDSQIAQVISALSESLAPQLLEAIRAMTQHRAPETPEKKEEL
jgi:uncharacterized spore protein YtfJ